MSADTTEIRRILSAEHAPLRDVLDRPGTRLVVLGGSIDPNAKVTIVLLDEYGPAFVIKVPTTKAAEGVVRNEAYALEALAELPLGPMAVSIPRVAGFMRHEGRDALVATAVPGTPMTVDYHGWHHTARRRHVRADFAMAGNWLADLQNRTAGPSMQISLISEALDRISDRFAGYKELPYVTRALSGAAARLQEHRAPRTVVHGDFWLGNIMHTNRVVTGVVDWESCVMMGEPLRDVARFATSYGLYLDRHTAPGKRIKGHGGLHAGPFGVGIFRMYEERTWLSAIVQNYVALALGRLGLPARLWRDVLTGGIADVAATADHPEFAEAHLRLLARRTPPPAVVGTVPMPRSAHFSADDAESDDTDQDSMERIESQDTRHDDGTDGLAASGGVAA